MDKSSMRKLLELVGGDKRPSENTTSWLWRISQTAGLHYRVVRAIWHGEAISFESQWKLLQAVRKYDKRLIETIKNHSALLSEADPSRFADDIAFYNELAGQIDRFSNKKS